MTYLEIYNSSFYENSNTFRGVVLMSSGNLANSYIYDSKFYNNTAFNGGVFYGSDRSFIQCTRCNISNNFAISAGAIQVEENSYFKFIDSDIYNNYASSSPISEILFSRQDSEINNWRMSNNIILSKDDILNNFITQRKL